jgi:hypothetical protein
MRLDGLMHGGGFVWRRGGIDSGPGKFNALIFSEDGAVKGVAAIFERVD